MADSVQIKEINHKHEAIADYMLAHPDMKKGEIAIALGYTQTWLSAVINSDAFIAYYDQRRALYNSELNQKTVVKLYNLANKAIDKVDKALDAEDCDPRYALDAKDQALQKLGFGNKGSALPGQNAQQINNYVVDNDTLIAARQRMEQAHGKKVFPGGDSGNGAPIEGHATVRPEETT